VDDAVFDAAAESTVCVAIIEARGVDIGELEDVVEEVVEEEVAERDVEELEDVVLLHLALFVTANAS
jgi:hypothetical protein